MILGDLRGFGLLPAIGLTNTLINPQEVITTLVFLFILLAGELFYPLISAHH